MIDIIILLGYIKLLSSILTDNSSVFNYVNKNKKLYIFKFNLKTNYL